MAEWMTPVYDRTQYDIASAIAKIAAGDNVTEHKGCFNVSDINRIENNTRYIADRLNVLAYVNSVTTATWKMTDKPNITEIKRLINNVSALIDAYYQTPDAPALPTTLLTYEQVNALERNMYSLKHLIDNEENEFRHCGTFNCGEEW